MVAFCKNCGTEIVDGAKFCHNCGCAASSISSYTGEQQQQGYSGKLYRCPGCGITLKSFMPNCPACGLELRGTKASSAVREFALKLETIEARREREGILSRIGANSRVSKTDAEKINLIRNFPVPNTKEDILEFMILAIGNINATVFGTFDVNKSDEALVNAWIAKAKQMYSKARSMCVGDNDISQIEHLYKDSIKDVKVNKLKRFIKYALVFSSPFILLAIGMILMHFTK